MSTSRAGSTSAAPSRRGTRSGSRSSKYWETRYLPAKNFGLLILTTSQGVVTHEQARQAGIGGELLGFVY